MSGVEVLGAAAAAIGLLETAIGLVARLRETLKRQKGLTRVLDEHAHELVKTKSIIILIEEEIALQTAAVAAGLAELDAIAQKLVGMLTEFQRRRGAVPQFFHLLRHGPRDESTLARLMDELGHAKTNLVLRISVAHVALSRGLQDGMVVNTALLEHVDTKVRSVVGEEYGLEVAKLVRSRLPSEDGVLVLSDADLESLQARCSQPFPRTGNAHMVADNITKDQALQINGPIGEQERYQASHTEITGNKAAGNSIQINSGMAMKAFSLLLQRGG